MRSEERQTAVVALGHLNIEATSSVLYAILPFLASRLALSYTLIGILVSLHSASVALFQPFFGYTADRWYAGRMAFIGVLMTGFMALIGLAPNFLTLSLVILLSGLGSGLFHPSAMTIISFPHNPHRGTLMSIFSAGGNVGVALAPLIGVMLVSLWGLEGTLLLFLPSLMVGGVVLKYAGSLTSLQAAHNLKELLGILKPRSRMLIPLMMVNVIRAAVYSSLLGFLPAYGIYMGLSREVAPLLLFVLLACGALGGLFAGILSDRYDSRLVLAFTFFAATPLLLALFHTTGTAFWLLLIPVGIMLLATMPVTIVVGHRILPEIKGVASSLTQGISWFIGALGVTLVGWGIDTIGFTPVFQALALLPTLGGALVLTTRLPPHFSE